MKNEIILSIILFSASMSFIWAQDDCGDAYVKITEFDTCDYGAGADFEIKVEYHMALFGDDDHSFNFWYTPERGDPYPYPYFDPDGLHRIYPDGNPRPHHGVDVAFGEFPNVNSNRSLVSRGLGIVKYAGQINGYGNMVLIYYPDINKTFLYAHLASFSDKLNDGLVECGESIGIGDADEAYPENPHVHIEVLEGEVAINELNAVHNGMPYVDYHDPLPYLYGKGEDEVTYGGFLDELTFELKYVPWGFITGSESWNLTEWSFFNEVKDTSNPYITHYYYPNSPQIFGEYQAEAKAWKDTIIKGEDNLDFYLEPCIPHLVILPTFSTVDVRVMDIYDYPADDPCERASAPIAALGFGTRGNWSAVSHTIRQRWPEPFKCYYAEGIIIGTPGYAVGC